MVKTLHNIKFSNLPMSIGCTRDMVWGDRNSSWIFFKKCKWGCTAKNQQNSLQFLL
jgi:hypothetical protein